MQSITATELNYEHFFHVTLLGEKKVMMIVMVGGKHCNSRTELLEGEVNKENRNANEI